VSSDHLRGTIAAELTDPAPAFSSTSAQLLKFHGTYQQDDRDTRTERKRAGLDVDHIFMVRVSVPGGVLTAEQYLTLDRLADHAGNGTLRITSRQGVQFHFVHKRELAPLVAGLTDHSLTTLGACGDVVRNITCCPAPLPDRAGTGLEAHTRAVAAAFRPRTSAYGEIWRDGEVIDLVGRPDDREPLYGDTYLPRKFKIGFAFPGDNCIDVHTHDIGIVPVLDDGTLNAFTLVVGGGLGKSHKRPDTFPRLADPLTTVAADDLLDVLTAIICVQRDHGDRQDREHARMKYLVHEWGIRRFRDEVAAKLDRALPDPAPVVLSEAADHLGWHDQGDGRWFLGVKVENGRIADRDGERVRSGLRAVVEQFAPGVRLTPREDLLLTDVDPADRGALDSLLASHGVRPADEWIPLMRQSFACPALPTCGLALTESERVLPDVLDELHAELVALDLGDLDLHTRMTGCPNGCARPYTAEIGLVGRGKHSYDIHLGGEPVGVRLNEVFAENVPRDQLVPVLRPVLVDYRDTRDAGERFGDWCARIGVGNLRAQLGTERWVRPSRARDRDGSTPSPG
jgi:sulfite reductase (ferredoxin)